MAIDQETLYPLHKLTYQGKEEYDKVITREGNKVFFQVKHPILYFFYNLSKKLNLTKITDKIEEKYL